MKIVIDKDSIINVFAISLYAVSGGDYSAVKDAVKEMLEKINYDPYEERPTGKWIPVSERLPDDETEVLIQYGQSMMVGYHIFDHTIYPFEYEDENETGWYDSKDDFICCSDEVIAWMPLPKSYKEEAENG